VTADGLMAKAESRYATLVLAHTWAAPSQEQQELVALTAKIAELKVQVNKAKQQPKKVVNKKGAKKELLPKKKKGAKKGKALDNKFAWKAIPPKDGAPTTKIVDGKTYNFCLNHGEVGMWVIHELSACEARKKPAVHGSNDSTRIQRALNLSAIVDTFADDDQTVDSEDDE
jgi:hypothetical protein